MRSLSSLLLSAVLAILSISAMAQEENGITREIEMGGLFTSGNTEGQSLNFAGAINIDRGKWDYDFSLDALYSSSESEVKGQRWYTVASANYEVSETSFFQTRFSHEDDRFSGYDSQSDLTVNYGGLFLQGLPNIGLRLNAGLGIRWSQLNNSDFDEPILRFAGDYDWNVSETAVFSQELSTEYGTDSNIYRSESSIETQILENLSLRFSLNIKHQTVVPHGREETDTETAITFIMSF